MSIDKTIQLNIDASKAQSDVNKLTNQFGELNDTIKGTSKSANKALDEIEKNTKETEKGTKTLAEGFKATGVALKAMGIGLIISAMTSLKEVFMSNQKVADTFGAVMGTVTNIFSQVTNIIVSVIEKVSNASNGFKGLTNVISGLLTLSLTPLKTAFYGIKLVIEELRLAWEESIFGDGDVTTIKNLTKSISETQDSLKKVGTDAIDAGKKVAANIGNAILEVGAVVSGTIDGVSKISIAASYEQAKANIQLQNTAKLAEANQARMVEQYDRQAEKLRQVRDEERNSVKDRIKANDQLREVLNNQEAAMLGQAAAQIAAAKATLYQNNNIENQVALTNALANREGVLAQVEGLRSEQKANDLALNKELIDLTKTKQEAETQLSINQKLFDADRLKDQEKNLIAQKEALNFSSKLEIQRLQNIIDTTKAGTQARVDAENEYALKKQEIENSITLKQDEIDAFRINKKLENNKSIIDNEQLSFETRLQAITDREALENDIIFKSQEEKTAFEKQNADARKKIAGEEKNAKLLALQETAKTLSGLGDLLGKQTVAGKVAAVASATIETFLSAQKAYSATVGIPYVGPFLAPINAGIAVAAGLKNVKSILSVQVPGGGGGSAPSAGAATPAAPSFNVVGNSGVNQIAGVMQQQGAPVVKTYVTAGDVTTAQGLNRNIVSNATLG